MIVIPEQIKKLLGKDEVIEQEFNLKKWFSLKGYSVYTSNLRLFIDKNNSVTKVPYDCISKIKIKNERRTFLIVLGILHSLAGALIFWIRGEGYSLLMIPAGLFIIYSGFFRVQHIELMISGWSKPLKIKGHGEKLDSLMDLIMMRREANDSKNI